MGTDTLAVGYSVKASETPRTTLAPYLAALTEIAEAYAAQDAHPESLRVEAEADRLDLDAMEHTRQSRLQRWQEQRT